MKPPKRKLRIAICGLRGIPHSYSGTEAFIAQLAPRLVDRGSQPGKHERRERRSHLSGRAGNKRNRSVGQREQHVLWNPVEHCSCLR